MGKLSMGTSKTNCFCQCDLSRSNKFVPLGPAWLIGYIISKFTRLILEKHSSNPNDKLYYFVKGLHSRFERMFINTTEQHCKMLSSTWNALVKCI